MRALKFYSVGALGIGVQVAALWLLHQQAGLSLTLATALAVECALLHNFAWHERWTWRDRPAAAHQRWARLVKFHATAGLISLVGNVTLTTFLHHVLAVPYLLANVFSIFACSVANYLASEWVVFRRSNS